jgi:hypothetical protein
MAEIMIKQLGLHEGLWGVYFEFSLVGSNVPFPPDGKILMPASINFIQKVGLQRFQTPNNLAVDAAKVNPPATTRKRSG